GGSSKLDGVITQVLDTPMLGWCEISGVIYFYKLRDGTDVEAAPLIVRPDDYDDPDNTKVWQLILSTEGSLYLPFFKHGDGNPPEDGSVKHQGWWDDETDFKYHNKSFPVTFPTDWKQM